MPTIQEPGTENSESSTSTTRLVGPFHRDANIARDERDDDSNRLRSKSVEVNKGKAVVSQFPRSVSFMGRGTRCSNVGGGGGLASFKLRLPSTGNSQARLMNKSKVCSQTSENQFFDDFFAINRSLESFFCWPLKL